MIKAVHLSKHFGNVKAVDDVSLHIHKGEVVCIIGPSGSGKSTLIRCLHGLEVPDSGELYVNDKLVDFSKDTTKDLAHIGFVFQLFNLFPHKTVLENLTLGPVKAGGVPQKQAEETAIKLLTRVGLAEKANDYPASLSGGQKQRVALSRAVLKKAAIMIFDDATSALDLKTEADFYNELARTSPASTKIIVAQRVASVRRASRILILDNGCIVAEGTHQELLQSCKIYQDIYRSQIGDIASAENATPMPGSASTDAAFPTAAGGRAVTADA